MVRIFLFDVNFNLHLYDLSIDFVEYSLFLKLLKIKFLKLMKIKFLKCYFLDYIKLLVLLLIFIQIINQDQSPDHQVIIEYYLKLSRFLFFVRLFIDCYLTEPHPIQLFHCFNRIRQYFLNSCFCFYSFYPFLKFIYYKYDQEF